MAFQANDLPNPLVEISAANKPSHVSWTKHTLNPKFPNMEPAMYDKLPNDTIITVKMFDNKGTLTNRRRRVLLGSSTVCCAHFTGADPLYVWLPMRQPRKRRRNKSGLLPPPGHIPDVQASTHPPMHAPHTCCIPLKQGCDVHTLLAPMGVAGRKPQAPSAVYLCCLLDSRQSVTAVVSAQKSRCS